MTGRRSVAFTISVDTEEDNWTPAINGITLRNISQIPRLTALFDELGVRATFFTTYQVARDPASAAILRTVRESGRAEIGAHLHPWNTPPLSGLEWQRDMLCSYPAAEQFRKLRVLVDTIQEQIGGRIESFRAGRFGVGTDTIVSLAKLDIRVDSSVTPLLTWSRQRGPSFLAAPLEPYRLKSGEDVTAPEPDGDVIEVPISVGYTRFEPSRWRTVAAFLNGRVARTLHLGGLASVSGFMRRVTLSAETNSSDEMMEMTRRMLAHGCNHLHMFFHSSTLLAGLTPFTRTAAAVDRLYDEIRKYVEALSAVVDIKFQTVTECARSFQTWGTPGSGRAPE